MNERKKSIHRSIDDLANQRGEKICKLYNCMNNKYILSFYVYTYVYILNLRVCFVRKKEKKSRKKIPNKAVPTFIYHLSHPRRSFYPILFTSTN